MALSASVTPARPTVFSKGYRFTTTISIETTPW